MKKFFNQTNGKILLVGIMLIGMIFLGSNKKELDLYNPQCLRHGRITQGK